MPALPYRAGDGAAADVDAGGRSLRAAADDELVLVTAPSMRARRHPRAIAAMWAWQTVLALLVSWPAAGLVSAAWSGDPNGDAPLWAPGGHALLDWMWHDARGLSSTTHAAEIVLILGAVAGLVPMTALMIALAHATRDRQAVGFVRSLSGGLRAFPSMLLLGVLFGLLQGLVVLVGALLGHGVATWTHDSMGEARSQQLEAVVVVLFLAAASAVGVMHDLARAAVVRFKVRAVRAFALGARTFRLTPLSLWWSWAWRALASIAPVLAAAPVAGQLGGRGGFALAFLALLHQAVIAARVGLRASWLARALRGVDGALRRAR
jgi:hypothetical protein